MNFDELVNAASDYFSEIRTILEGYEGPREKYLSLQEDLKTLQADLQSAYKNHDAAMMQDTYNILVEFHEHVQSLVVENNSTNMAEQPQQVIVSEPPSQLVEAYNQMVTRYYTAIKSITTQEEHNNSKVVHKALCDCDDALQIGNYQTAEGLLGVIDGKLKTLEQKSRAQAISQANQQHTYIQYSEPEPDEETEKSAEMYQRQIILLKGEFRGLRDRLPIGSHAFKQYRQAIHYADMASDYEVKGDYVNAYTTWTMALDEIKSVFKG